MNEERQYLNYMCNNSKHPYGSIQHPVPYYPDNFRHYYYNKHHPPTKCVTTKGSKSAHIVQKKPLMRGLSVFTKLLVPYYTLTFLMSIMALILYFVVPFNETHKALFSAIIFTTIFGACIGCIASWKWSALSQFRDLLLAKNKEWKQSITSLSQTKRNLKDKVHKMEFSVDTLGRSAADLERTLSQFNELKAQLQKLTTKSQQVTDVLDNLLSICNDLTQLIRQHAKTELMVAYYDAAVFASRETDNISLTCNKWRNFRARLDSETRRVFDESGGFDAIPRDKYDRVDIHDLEKVLSFVIDERGFDEIYSMFS